MPPPTMAVSTLMLSLLLLVASGAAGAANAALDDVCAVLGGYYVTPEACASALCHDPSPSPCAAARDAHAVAALAARLAAANATAARDSVRAAADAAGEGAAAKKKASLLSCLQLYTGAAAALEWAAGSVAAGRYPGAREVLQAARYVPTGCDGMAMAAGAAVPPENGGFDAMVTVAHAVVASLSKGY